MDKRRRKAQTHLVNAYWCQRDISVFLELEPLFPNVPDQAFSCLPDGDRDEPVTCEYGSCVNSPETFSPLHSVALSKPALDYGGALQRALSCREPGLERKSAPACHHTCAASVRCRDGWAWDVFYMMLGAGVGRASL